MTALSYNNTYAGLVKPTMAIIRNSLRGWVIVWTPEKVLGPGIS